MELNVDFDSSSVMGSTIDYNIEIEISNLVLETNKYSVRFLVKKANHNTKARIQTQLKGSDKVHERSKSNHY